MTKAEAKKMMGEGQRMISGAEFQFAFGDITREEFDARRTAGNKMICDAMDAIDRRGAA